MAVLRIWILDEYPKRQLSRLSLQSDVIFNVFNLRNFKWCESCFPKTSNHSWKLSKQICCYKKKKKNKEIYRLGICNLNWGALESSEEPDPLVIFTKIVQDLLIKSLCFFHSLVFGDHYYLWKQPFFQHTAILLFFWQKSGLCTWIFV